jgi:anti-sigma factor RsiW
MSHLYDESPAESREQFHAHLEECAECRSQLATWQGATRQMSEWQLPRRRRALRSAVITRWAVAAAVAVLAVVGAANILAMKREVKQLRAEVQAQRELNAVLAEATEQAAKTATSEARSLVAAVVENLEEKRLGDQRTVLTALQKLNAQHVTDYAKLRKELETVAVFSEAGLQRAENQISSLAYTPANFSNQK